MCCVVVVCVFGALAGSVYLLRETALVPVDSDRTVSRVIVSAATPDKQEKKPWKKTVVVSAKLRVTL